jgi:hypothetical protein
MLTASGLRAHFLQADLAESHSHSETPLHEPVAFSVTVLGVIAQLNPTTLLEFLSFLEFLHETLTAITKRTFPFGVRE